MTDRRSIVSKFRRGLRRDTDKVIARDIGLVLDDPQLWYDKAWNHELVAKLTKAYHDTQMPALSRGMFHLRPSTAASLTTPSLGTRDYHSSEIRFSTFSEIR
jgi:hypothetical protein